MKISKIIVFSVLLLSSCAVKYPNYSYPQGVRKIYIATDSGGDWGNKFFQKKLQALLQEHKVELRVGKKIKSIFMQNADFNPIEQQKQIQDIIAFKPDIILELSAYNFAVNSEMANFVNKPTAEVAVVRDTADLKKAIEKAIEVQDNKDNKKLINHARVSAYLFLPNQYVPVWHAGIVETDLDEKNTAEGSLTKAAQSLVDKMIEAKIIKP